MKIGTSTHIKSVTVPMTRHLVSCLLLDRNPSLTTKRSSERSLDFGVDAAAWYVFIPDTFEWNALNTQGDDRCDCDCGQNSHHSIHNFGNDPMSPGHDPEYKEAD